VKAAAIHVGGALLLSLLVGCVIVYAPAAERVAGQMHDQQADYMPIEQQIPIEPRVADNLDVTGITGIKGDVGSGNTIASPSGSVKLK
jgi:hypothetical protein